MQLREMNPIAARPASGSRRQARYEGRRRQRQAPVKVWIDHDDIAWLATLPWDRSTCIRGLIRNAREHGAGFAAPRRPRLAGLRRLLGWRP